MKKSNNNTQINGNNNSVIKIDGSVNISKVVLVKDKEKEVKIKKEVEVVQHNEEIHISPSQQYAIKEIIDDTAKMMEGTFPKKNYYMLLYGALKKKFNIPKYSLLEKKDFNEAISFLNKKRAIYRKTILANQNIERYKEYTIKAIYSRWNEVRKDEDIYEYIKKKIDKDISSLKDLSKLDLDKLYQSVFALRKRKAK